MFSRKPSLSSKSCKILIQCSSHTALFILYTLVGFTYYFAAKKPRPSQVFAVAYCISSILVAVYTYVEKYRTGSYPTWPIDYSTQSLRFTLGSAILSLSLRVCELCGNWVHPNRPMRIGLEIYVLAACVAGMAGSRWNRISGALHAMSVVLTAEFSLDREYLQGLADGTQPTFEQVWHALIRGRLPKPPYITEEERKARTGEGKRVGMTEAEVDLPNEATPSALPVT